LVPYLSGFISLELGFFFGLDSTRCIYCYNFRMVL